MAVMKFTNFIKQEEEITHETIEPQINDPIVKIMKDAFSECIIKAKTVPGSNISGYYDIIKPELKALEDALYERFGLPLVFIDPTNKILEESGYGPCTIPPFIMGPSRSNYRDMSHSEEVIKSIEKLKGMSPVAKFFYRRLLRCYPKFLEDSFDVITLRGYMDLQEIISKYGLIVDLKNAKIINFPKTYKCPIHFPLTAFALGQDVITDYARTTTTPEEMTAIVLHEIGHVFTAVELCVQSYSNNVMFEETLQDMAKKKESVSNCFLVAYEKAFKDNTLRKELVGASDAQVAIKTLTRIMKRYEWQGTEAATMGEDQADIFASRFGLGKHIATALSPATIAQSPTYHLGKIFKINIGLRLLFLISIPFLLTAIVGAIINCVMYLPVLGTGVFVFLPFFIINRYIRGINNSISMAIDGMIQAMELAIKGEKSRKGKNIYSSSSIRVEKMKLDLIRQLRLYKLPPEVVNKYVKFIDDIDNMLKEYKKFGLDGRDYFFNTPFRDWLDPVSADNTKFGGFDYELEKLMENPLWIDRVRTNIEEAGKNVK